MDYANSKLTYDTTISDTGTSYRSCEFKDITFSANIGDAAKALLIALGMAPKAGTIVSTGNAVYWDKNQAERSFHRGGLFYSTALGFASFFGNYDRSNSLEYFGFRSAYCQLPAA